MQQQIVTITQTLQQSQLPAESKLSAVLLFSVLRLHLNCGFATFLQHLAGPGRSDIVSFTRAMQQTGTPVGNQALLLAHYLDAQDSGATWTLREFVDKLLGSFQQAAVKADEDAMVARVVQSKPAAVVAQTAPAAQSGPAQQPPFDGGTPAAGIGWSAAPAQPTQAAPPAPHPSPLSAAQAVSEPVGATVGAGWSADAVDSPPSLAETVVPTADPLPDWVRPGARVAYELGGERILANVSRQQGRHLDLVDDLGRAFAAVAVAYLQPVQEPVTLNYAPDHTAVTNVQRYLALSMPPDGFQPTDVIQPLTAFELASPVDGSPIQAYLDVVADAEPSRPPLLSFRLVDREENTLMEHPLHNELMPEWALQYGGQTYRLLVQLPDAPPPEPKTEEAAAPAAGRRRRAAAGTTKSRKSKGS